MNRSPNHIPIDQLQAYLDQSLDQDVYQEIESHLDQCSACRDQFSSLETVITKLDNLPDIELEKDFSMSVITQLSEESKFSPGHNLDTDHGSPGCRYGDRTAHSCYSSSKLAAAADRYPNRDPGRNKHLPDPIGQQLAGLVDRTAPEFRAIH